jgi:alpha-tubulin suppressor-like RCC1 family protein
MAIDIKFPMIIGGSSGSSFIFGKLSSNISSTTTTPAPSIGGQLWVWGANYFGTIGDNTNVKKSSPVQTIAGGSDWTQISGKENHNVGMKTDGTVWAWGNNDNGQLGDDTTVNKSSPVQTIVGGTNWSSVACGGNHTAAIKTDGTLWLWGQNNTGQLGDDTGGNKSSPVQTIVGGTNWSSVSCGRNHTAAIKKDGTLWLWGLNYDGRLGDDTTAGKSSPVQTIVGGTNWSSVSCGRSHTAAIKKDGTLWLWGGGYSGVLGDDTTDSKSSPVQTIVGGTTWSKVDGGYSVTAAIKTDGTLWLWGQNYDGNLGDDTTVSKSSPVQTIAGGSWTSVYCGGSTYDKFSAGIKADGTLWTWGHNSYFARVGDNTTIDRSSPVQTIVGGTNWISVSYTAAIKA